MKSALVRRGSNSVFAAFLFITFLLGIAGALQTPTLSRFLTDEVKAISFWIGFFYSVNAAVAILVSFFLARRSDYRGDRRRLIMFCCAMAVGNSLLFAYSRNYLTLVTVGVTLAALANSTMPQLFALAREYADQSARDVVLFSTFMRAQMSLAWVIGPPLSFMLALNYGFTFMYLCAATVFVIGGFIVWRILPSVAQVVKTPEQMSASVSAFKDKDVMILFIASMLMWTCNMMYLIDIPLYTVADLGLNRQLAGLLMGTAAGLEIPIMLLSAVYVKKFGKRKTMRFALINGLLFYGGLVLFQDKSILLVLQIFNALFIGIVAAIGMLYFQDLMPGRPGTATTMFTNSVLMGTILAGVLQGLLAEKIGHFSIYWAAVGLMVLSLVLSYRVRDV